MSTILLTIVDFGKHGISSTDTSPNATRRSIMLDLVECQFNREDCRGLLQVIELDLETCVSTDITREIASEAEHYIDAENLDCDGNVLRLLKEYNAVPDWVRSIRAGVFYGEDLAHAA